MIRIINLRNYQLKENELLIKVDRSSVLGNPFPMHNKTEEERNRVCNQYEIYFNKIINNKDLEQNQKFMNELRRIYILAKKQDIALGCWCYPKRCHSETIKAFLEQFL